MNKYVLRSEVTLEEITAVIISPANTDQKFKRMLYYRDFEAHYTGCSIEGDLFIE